MEHPRGRGPQLGTRHLATREWSEGVDDLEDGDPGRVAFRRECLVQAVAAHSDTAGEPLEESGVSEPIPVVPVEGIPIGSEVRQLRH